MKRGLLFLVSLLLISPLSSCSSNNSNPLDGQVVTLNNFENMRDVYRLNSLFNQYDTKGKVDINKDKNFITSGDGSMHLKTTTGARFEFMQYFETAECGKVELESMSKIDFDVFNASSYATKCMLNLYCDDDVTSLLNVDADLPAYTSDSKFVHITFDLSKIAIKYNLIRIRGIGFKVVTYSAGEFYFDNLTLTYGSELSEEDKKYEPVINSIIEGVDGLNADVTLNDEQKIREINSLYTSLPVLYRQIIPNLDKLDTINKNFAALVKPITINYDKNVLFPCSEFYGYTSFSNIDLNSNMSFYHDVDHKFNNESGSTRLYFNGSAYSGMNCTGILGSEVEKFDYIQFTLLFETTENRGISIWLNGTTRYLLYPNVETTYTVSTKIFNSNTPYILFHQLGINESKDLVDPILSSVGSVYMSNFIAYGRSLQTLREDALKAIAKLPDSSTITTEADIMKNLTIIRECESYLNNTELMRMYPDLFTNEQKTNIVACANIVKNYGVIFGTNEKTNTYSFWYYGVPFDCSVVDSESFGSVFECNIVDNIKEQKEQYFKVTGITDSPTLFEKNFFYIYNPTDYEFICSVKDTDWINFSSAPTTKLPSKEWTKIEFDPEVFTYATSKEIAIGVNVGGDPAVSPIPVGGINGKWLISSIYGYDKITGEKVANEIDALPDVADLIDEKVSIRYCSKIRTTYKKYSYLPYSEQVIVGDKRYNKLYALYKAVEPYADLYSKECIKGFDYTWEGTINHVDNDEIGGAYEVYVDSITESGGLNGIQLLFHSENIKPKSGSTIGFFYIYNPTDDYCYGSFYPDNWGTLTPLNLAPHSWTKVKFSVSKFGEKPSLLMLDLIPEKTTWIISHFYSE